MTDHAGRFVIYNMRFNCERDGVSDIGHMTSEEKSQFNALTPAIMPGCSIAQLDRVFGIEVCGRLLHSVNFHSKALQPIILNRLNTRNPILLLLLDHL